MCLSEDLLAIRLEERLKQYSGLPNTEIVRNSIIEEIQDELNSIDESEK
jgi:hypothetical protein